MRGERGIVGVNLVLTIAFALFAVIMLSRVTLAASQIDARVKTITSDVGPGSNVSHLDETQKLNDVGQKAEAILDASKNLSAHLGSVNDVVKHVDGTVSSINSNAAEINGTVKSINSTASALAPVVNTIHGSGGISGGGVEAINLRVATLDGSVNNIHGDLSQTLARVGTIATSARQICLSPVILGGNCG
jgi:methyl-accepting chemotaxis protein